MKIKIVRPTRKERELLDELEKLLGIPCRKVKIINSDNSDLAKKTHARAHLAKK